MINRLNKKTLAAALQLTQKSELAKETMLSISNWSHPLNPTLLTRLRLRVKVRLNHQVGHHFPIKGPGGGVCGGSRKCGSNISKQRM